LGIAFSAEYLAQPFPEVEIDQRPQFEGATVSGAIANDPIGSSAELEALTGLPVLSLVGANKIGIPK